MNINNILTASNTLEIAKRIAKKKLENNKLVSKIRVTKRVGNLDSLDELDNYNSLDELDKLDKLGKFKDNSNNSNNSNKSSKLGKLNKLDNCFLPSKNPKPIEIKARLTSENSAAYHLTDACIEENKESYLYKILNSKRTLHLKFLSSIYKDEIDNLEHIYKSPFNQVEFTFQIPKNKSICFNKQIPCMIDTCIGELCKLTMRIMPYDFINKVTKKRIIGLVIKVSRIDL